MKTFVKWTMGLLAGVVVVGSLIATAFPALHRASDLVLGLATIGFACIAVGLFCTEG